MNLRTRFSERNKIIEPRDAFQVNDIDEGLRNRLWNLIQGSYFDSIPIDFVNIKYQADMVFFKRIYDEFFKTNSSIEKHLPSINKDIKNQYSSFVWYEIYDFIEFISEIHVNENLNKEFKNKVNEVLENEMSGYRFVNGYIAKVIDKVEIEEIEEALKSTISGARIHLSNALESLSDRENPDYINSIKESISAVESAVNKLSGKTNVALNRCLQKLPFDIDNNFKQGMVKMYSWTSSSDGIRHGITNDEIKSSFAEAKYMLVICSAFVNYLTEKEK